MCHSGGEYESKPGRWVSEAVANGATISYGYDGSGGQTALAGTLNSYGKAYFDSSRNADAIRAIEDLDSDRDGFIDKVEIAANRFPGDDTDDPSLVTAPFRCIPGPIKSAGPAYPVPSDEYFPIRRFLC